MTNSDSTELLDGVSEVHGSRNKQTFVGDESVFISAGWICPEWLTGLGSQGRQIAFDAKGGFSIVHEGRGSALTHQHLEGGAVSVRRLADGLLQLTKYQTMTERQECDRLFDERWNRRCASVLDR
jgi:hypothetical protein